MRPTYRRPLALMVVCAGAMTGLLACGGVDAEPADEGSPSYSVAIQRLTPPPRADTPDPTAQPESLDPKPPEPSVPTTQSAAYAQIGETVPFRHLRVAVVQTDRSDDQFDLLVKTCVTRLPAGSSAPTVRLGWEPWSLSTSDGVKATAAPPADPRRAADLYPTETSAAVGQCVRGWISIAVPQSAEIAMINYQNGLGEVGSWLPV